MLRWERAHASEWVSVLQDLLHLAQELDSSIADATDASPETICALIADAVSHPVLTHLVRRLQSSRGAKLYEFWCLFISALAFSAGDPKSVPAFHLVRFVATALAAFPERVDVPVISAVHVFEFRVFLLARRLATSSAATREHSEASIEAPSDLREDSASASMYTCSEASTYSPDASKLAVVTLLKHEQSKAVELPLSVTAGQLACKYGGKTFWEIRRPNGGPAVFETTTVGELLRSDGVFLPPYHLTLELAESNF